MRLKFISLATTVTAVLLMSACETERAPTSSAGSTFDMPNAGLGKGSFPMIENGKRKMFYESTDLDIITDSASCCTEGQPKEVAILRTNKEIEIRVGDYTPNIMLDNVDVRCCHADNANTLEVMVEMKVAHGGGEDKNLPSVDVPVFVSAMDPATGEVYSHGHAMVKVDMNKPFETQYARIWFDISDLKARNLMGWSLITGIMKSDMNRKFEAEVAKEKEHSVAEAAGKYEINTTRTGTIAPALRGSEDSSTGLVVR